jgi:hypothetical protein
VWGEIELSVTEHHLLASMADQCKENSLFWGSVEFFAHRTGLSERCVKKYKGKWLGSGAITLVGKLVNSRVILCAEDEINFGRGIIPVYRLDLAKFPRKKSWSELRGIPWKLESGDDDFRRPAEPMHPFGKRVHDETEKDARGDMERVHAATVKGAPEDTKGCTPEQERVHGDATHNKAEPLIEPLGTIREPGPLPDPSSAAHWLLTEINQKNIATVPLFGSMKIAASALDTWKRQEPERSFTDLAAHALESATIYARSPGRNWYAFFANGLCRSLKEGEHEKHQGNIASSNGRAYRGGPAGKYDDEPDFTFAV